MHGRLRRYPQLACPGVQGVHDLRTRHAGDRTFVELHLEVEGHLSVEEGHAICDMGEGAIKQLFPAIVEITAHLEPAGIDDDRLDHPIASGRNT